MVRDSGDWSMCSRSAARAKWSSSATAESSEDDEAPFSWIELQRRLALVANPNGFH
jgi:hypothetical protein